MFAAYNLHRSYFSKFSRKKKQTNILFHDENVYQPWTSQPNPSLSLAKKKEKKFAS